jgi:hypothetical protein
MRPDQTEASTAISCGLLDAKRTKDANSQQHSGERLWAEAHVAGLRRHPHGLVGRRDLGTHDEIADEARGVDCLVLRFFQNAR